MIGFDATNSLGQGLAAREKIFSFTLSYFAFINDSIPSFSFVINSENKQDILSFVSGKITEYFENFVIQTEGEKNEDGTLINPKDRSPLAKYYLAAIYYYEPSFDFSSTGISDIYKLGETYLLEMFSENLSLLLDKSKKYTNIRVPSFPNATNQDLWKYFTYAMLASEYNAQYVNIIQQPVSLVSRSGNYLFSYLKNGDKKTFDLFYTNSELTTHENKKITAKLSNLNSSKYDIQQLYDSMNWNIVGSWRNMVETLIDPTKDKKSLLPSNKYERRSVSLLKDMEAYVESINPQKIQDYSQADRENLYFSLLNSIEVARTDYNDDDELDVLDGDNYDYAKGTDAKGNTLFPYDGSRLDLIYPSNYNPLNTRQYIQGTGYFADLLIDKILVYYRGLIEGYQGIVNQIDFTVQNIAWEDSPNIIKSYVKKTVQKNLSFEDFVKLILFPTMENQPESVEVYLSDPIAKDVAESVYSDYIKNFENWGALSVDGYVNTNLALPPQYNSILADLFVTYFANAGKVEFPTMNNKYKDVELSVFFEFSFQPNLEKIKQKFGQLFSDLQFDYFSSLKENFFLNFSKTETYQFLEYLFGTQFQQLTIEEFNSLFDLCVALQHKVSKKYFESNFISNNNFLSGIKTFSSFFDNTNYTFRRWIDINENKKKYSRNLLIFNPLTDQSKNNASIPIQSLQTNACVNLGPVTNFNINIPTFNPVNTFRDDELAYKFIDMIDNTSIGDYLKNNYNYMPYDFSVVAKNLLANKASSLPENFIINNDGLFVNSHSLLSKNLLENLITTIEQLKEQ